MKYSAVLSALATSLVLVFVALSPVRSQDDPASPMSDDQVTTAASALGKSPDWVHSQFGRPALAEREWCCTFAGYQSSDAPQRKPVLVHAYDVESGGRLAFLYDRRIGGDEWTVVGIVYDVLDSQDRKMIGQFFPSGAPRGTRQFTCYDKDFFHHPDGGLTSLSTYALWTVGNGRTLFAKYLVGGKPPTHYDVDSGRDSLAPITDLNSLPVVQWGIFKSVRSVMDLHIMPNNDDFSIVTQFKTCFR